MTHEILYLSRADVEAAGVTMPEIIDRLAVMFREKGHGRTEMPPKPDLHPGPPGNDNFIHAMPAYCGALQAAGLKWIAGFPGNRDRGLPYVTGLIVLNDVETGLPLAVMDATWVTAMRTGAASAIAARHLARPDSAVVAIIGCGVQARTNLEALAVVLPRLATVRAHDLHPDRARAFAEEMRRRFPRLAVEVSPTPHAAIEGADVIVTGTPIRRHPEPLLEAAWFAPGALGLPLDYDSYWTPAAMAAADRFYTDDTPQLVATQARGVFFQQIPPLFADLGEVVAGLKEGRRSPGERLLCLNMGIALDDMATAPLVLERARERGLGTRLPL